MVSAGVLHGTVPHIGDHLGMDTVGDRLITVTAGDHLIMVAAIGVETPTTATGVTQATMSAIMVVFTVRHQTVVNEFMATLPPVVLL